MTDAVKFPVLEETIDITKTPVDRGGYRITKRVRSREETVDLAVREQRVVVERRPVGTTLPEGSAAPGQRYEGDVLVIPVVEEIVVTSTRLRVVEELRVSRLDVRRSTPRQVTLRREEIDIERLDADDLSAAERSSPSARPGRHQQPRFGAHTEETTMSSVLVGMFDTQAAAAEARSKLLAAGFSSSAVALTGASSTGDSAAILTDDTPHEGGVKGWFKSLFGEDDHPTTSTYADTYEEAFRRGGYGVSITAADDTEIDRAEQILNENGAVDIDEKSQTWKNEGWTGAAYGAVSGAAGKLEAGATQKLQEVEEELKVGKRAVARGGVRIFSRMTEVPVEETVRLREERAHVQRTAVDRPATEADFAAFKEGSIEVRETGEEAVVSKTARVIGEVSIGKDVSEREETIRDTVRKTTVDVEQIDSGSATGTASVTGTPGGTVYDKNR